MSRSIVIDAMTGETHIEDDGIVVVLPEDVAAPAPTVEDRLAAIEDTTGAIIGILASIEGVTL